MPPRSSRRNSSKPFPKRPSRKTPRGNCGFFSASGGPNPKPIISPSQDPSSRSPGAVGGGFSAAGRPCVSSSTPKAAERPCSAIPRSPTGPTSDTAPPRAGWCSSKGRAWPTTGGRGPKRPSGATGKRSTSPCTTRSTSPSSRASASSWGNIPAMRRISGRSTTTPRSATSRSNTGSTASASAAAVPNTATCSTADSSGAWGI